MAVAMRRVDQHRRIGDAREERTRFQQRPRVLHLRGPGLGDGFLPWQQRIVHGLPIGRPHLPDGVMSVRVAERAVEEIPVQRPPHVAGDRVPHLLGVERDRMVFVDRLAVEHGLDRRAAVIDARLVVAARVLRRVTVLAHVEVEPVGVVEVLGGALPAGGMEGDQVRPAIAGAKAARGGLDDRAVRLGFDRTVTAEDPDHARVLVARAEPAAVGLRVRGREDLRSDAPFLVPLVAPRGQQADVEAQAVGRAHDPVDVREIRLVGSCRVVVDERTFAVGIGRAQAIEFGKRDGLDDGEAALRAIAQVPLGIVASLAMEQLPRRVAEPEERLAVGGHEEAPVLGDRQAGQLRRRRGRQAADQSEHHQSTRQSDRHGRQTTSARPRRPEARQRRPLPRRMGRMAGW